MTRRYTLDEITHASGPAYAEALRQPTVERAMRIFTERLVDGLKALPERVQTSPQSEDWRSFEFTEDPPSLYHSNPPRLPQKSSD